MPCFQFPAIDGPVVAQISSRAYLQWFPWPFFYVYDMWNLRCVKEVICVVRLKKVFRNWWSRRRSGPAAASPDMNLHSIYDTDKIEFF